MRGEVLHHEFAPDQATIELESRDAQAQLRHRRGDQVLEAPFILVVSAPSSTPRKMRRRDVERQLLVGGEGEERPCRRRPSRAMPCAIKGFMRSTYSRSAGR